MEVSSGFLCKIVAVSWDSDWATLSEVVVFGGVDKRTVRMGMMGFRSNVDWETTAYP